MRQVSTVRQRPTSSTRVKHGSHVLNNHSITQKRMGWREGGDGQSGEVLTKRSWKGSGRTKRTMEHLEEVLLIFFAPQYSSSRKLKRTECRECVVFFCLCFFFSISVCFFFQPITIHMQSKHGGNIHNSFSEVKIIFKKKQNIAH